MAVFFHFFYDSTSVLTVGLLLPLAMLLMTGKAVSYEMNRLKGLIAVLLAFIILLTSGTSATFFSFSKIFTFNLKMERMRIKEAETVLQCPEDSPRLGSFLTRGGGGEEAGGLSQGPPPTRWIALMAGPGLANEKMVHNAVTQYAEQNGVFFSSGKLSDFHCSADMFIMSNAQPGVMHEIPHPFQALIISRDPKSVVVEVVARWCQANPEVNAPYSQEYENLQAEPVKQDPEHTQKCSLEEFNRRINVALTEAEAGLKPFKDWKHKAHHRCNGIFGYLCLAVGVASSPKSRHSHVSVVNYETLQSFNPIMKAVASESAAASDDGARQMIEALVGQFMDQEATTFVANGGDRAGKQAVAAEGGETTLSSSSLPFWEQLTVFFGQDIGGGFVNGKAVSGSRAFRNEAAVDSFVQALKHQFQSTKGLDAETSSLSSSPFTQGAASSWWWLTLGERVFSPSNEALLQRVIAPLEAHIGSRSSK